MYTTVQANVIKIFKHVHYQTEQLKHYYHLVYLPKFEDWKTQINNSASKLLCQSRKRTHKIQKKKRKTENLKDKYLGRCINTEQNKMVRICYESKNRTQRKF
jgi:hypothetical protein